MIIDANIWLETELDRDRADPCEAFLRKVSRGERSATVATFTLNTVALVMERNDADAASIQTFLKSLFSYDGLSVYRETLHDSYRATTYMQRYRLTFEDALTLRCARSTDHDVIVSYDTDFDPVDGVERRTPDELG